MGLSEKKMAEQFALSKNFAKYLNKMENDAADAIKAADSNIRYGSGASHPAGMMSDYKGDLKRMEKEWANWHKEQNKFCISNGKNPKAVLTSYTRWERSLEILERQNDVHQALIDAEIGKLAGGLAVLMVTSITEIEAKHQSLSKAMNMIQSEIKKAEWDVTKAEIRTVMNLLITFAPLPGAKVVHAIGSSVAKLTAHTIVEAATGEGGASGAENILKNVASDIGTVKVESFKVSRAFGGKLMNFMSFESDLSDYANAAKVLKSLKATQAKFEAALKGWDVTLQDKEKKIASGLKAFEAAMKKIQSAMKAAKVNKAERKALLKDLKKL